MPAEVLFVNPSPRLGRDSRGRFLKRGHRKTKRNPSRHRKVKAKRYHARRNPIIRHHRRRRARRNPDTGGMLMRTLFPTMVGAAGAIGTDIAMGFLPLPDTLKTGALRPVVKGVAAVGIGWVAGLLTNKGIGNKVMAGALTVVIYDTVRSFLLRTVPALPLGQTDEFPVLEFAGSGYPTQDMGAMIPVADGSMGELVDESSIGFADDDDMSALIETDSMGELVDESSIGTY